jgi:hypothetical protein
MTTQITSRDDLPFIAHKKSGARIDWRTTRDKSESPHIGRREGMQHFRDISELADIDEFEAYESLLNAMTSPDWHPGHCEERGFTEAILAAAMVGLRAMKAKSDMPFSTTFDPHHAKWCALNRLVEVMEAQLKALKVKPWRTYAEAGL